MRANQDHFLEGFLRKGQHICIPALPFHPKSHRIKNIAQPSRRRPVLFLFRVEVSRYRNALHPFAELAVGDCFQERLELG